jgi:hypothetical protein
MSASRVIVFLACAPTNCRTVALPWGGSLMECMLFGQQAVAAWAAPRGLTVPKGYRCTTERDA